ncbi:MAG TPA: GGDEF domain-containing protein [Gemmatimonadales bacterium]|jgi:diguanylate cyclase (GGDEF)-like protein|nr:GGDEF domain-containing protein [Gemmatimonadales bacterium]
MTTPQPAGLHTGPTWWPLLPALRDRTPGVTGVRVAWLIVGLMAVLSAYLEARLNWSGIPVTILGVELALTVYPPLILTLLLTLWFGPAWGGTFAWLATFTSALTSGMPLALAALFALATPLELLIVWGCLTILGISPDLGSRRDTLRYLGVAVIAATASSLAALLYVDVRALDILAGQRVWQGWIVGDVLQMALAVPILRLWGSEVRGWVDRQFPEPPLHEVSYTKSVLLVTGIVLCLVALVAQGVWRTLGSLQIPAEAVTSSGEPLLPRLRELGLFLGLLSLVTFATTMVFTATLARISERVRVISRHDPLTGALNRRAFEDEYRKEADRSRRLGRGMAAVLVDLDHFKTINDRFGHEAGDDVLRQVVRRIVGVIRDHDLLFRWGGDEFLVLLPHTAPADAPGLAERVRQACTEPIVALGVPEPVVLTVSCGVAAAAEAPKEAGALVALTDAAMYRAKRGGRDRVEVG